MKLRVLPVLAGAVALTLTATAISANAQLNNNPQWENKRQELITELDLTQEQQDEMTAIRESTRSQLESLLTEEQQDTLRTAFEEGPGGRQAMRSLDLSPDQRDQVRSIMRASRDQMREVLTEEQQEQMRELMQSRRGPGRGPGRGQGPRNFN
ncbi:Spy/CpxP family protein refolding chaperone [Spirulina sp. CS-785/01]|uniref:Spy/CpxP family protein refolding chaperone n=1 Tax=Spirulina sp. CS-785/01 TaxID=3021716 RepID=UPI00232E39C0|nr:Spy/CpxP family protein refolding chaperone [Spirulina sp. CS-785/01]MDB9315306.1 Spy/CpxP family protein refolding chaperone [Spirulina sp. CS-785/01]